MSLLTLSRWQFAITVIFHMTFPATGVPGLDLPPAQDMPLIAPAFWGLWVMFYGALLMFGAVFYATIQRFRRRCVGAWGCCVATWEGALRQLKIR